MNTLSTPLNGADAAGCPVCPRPAATVRVRRGDASHANAIHSVALARERSRAPRHARRSQSARVRREIAVARAEPPLGGGFIRAPRCGSDALVYSSAQGRRVGPPLAIYLKGGLFAFVRSVLYGPVQSSRSWPALACVIGRATEVS